MSTNKRDAADIIREQGPDALRETFDASIKQQKAKERLNGQPDAAVGAKAMLPLTLSRDEFLEGFIPPDYLLDGMLQRRFIYALTGQTGHAKTAIALLIARLVASQDKNAMLGKHRVEKGHVVYFEGENPDDVRMRVIGSDSQRSDNCRADRISFIPGVFNIAEMLAALAAEIKKRGGVDLVIIDTSAAYFLGQDENANPQMGAHARMLRELTKLPGSPCVLVLCHPIKNTTDPSQLVPRGGGAFLNEMDGNLSAWRQDDIVTLHHTGKFRGPGFEPITFRIEKITTTKLTDSKGRLIPTVQVVVISANEEEAQSRDARKDEDRLLGAMLENADRSIADLARACGWRLDDGEPYKSKVLRLMDKLAKNRLVTKDRTDRWQLTKNGENAARKQQDKKSEERIEDRGGSTTGTGPFWAKKGKRCGPEVSCIHCRQTGGDIFKIADGRVKGGHAEALHESCAKPWFSGEFAL